MCPNKPLRRLMLVVTLIALGLAAAVLLSGCAQKMGSEGRYKRFEDDEFFEDGRSARTMISGTVPIEPFLLNDPFYTGMENGEFVTTVPMTATDDVRVRGLERLNIYCAPCHGGALTGNGPVVQAGYPPPPDLYSPQFITVPVGSLYVTVTHGVGVMPGYAVQIPPADRWAVVTTLRSLQQSRTQPQPAATAQP